MKYVLICIKQPNLFYTNSSIKVGVVGFFDDYGQAKKSKEYLEDSAEFKGFEFLIGSGNNISDPKDEKEYRWPVGFDVAELL